MRVNRSRTTCATIGWSAWLSGAAGTGFCRAPRMLPIRSWSAIGSRVAWPPATREGLGAAALARWSLPQKQPAECDDVFAWLRQQNLMTPALAEAKVRAALAADNPRLAREFAPDVPVVAGRPCCNGRTCWSRRRRR